MHSQPDASSEVSGEAQQGPQGPSPEYVTREELQRQVDEFRALLDQASRQSQSLVDKLSYRIRQEIGERLRQIESTYNDPELAAYLGEDADAFKERKRQQALTEYFQVPPVAPPIDLMQHPAVIATMIATGIRQGDPEWIDPALYDGPESWAAAMHEAAQRKMQRSATQSTRPAPQPAPEQTTAPAPTAQPEKKPAQVSMGSGEGPRPTDPTEALAAYRAALAAGDRAEAARLSALIDRLARGGA